MHEQKAMEALILDFRDQKNGGVSLGHTAVFLALFILFF